MPTHVRKHTRNVNGKQVTVRSHDKKGNRKLKTWEREAIVKDKSYRPVSSFIQEVGRKPEGGMYVTIRGKQYPYPYAGLPQMKSLVQAASTGSKYNYSIKGRYF
jgi:hypothetical protein